MKNRFCPECAAECSEGDVSCPECGFPMTLELIADGGKLIIEGQHGARWKRISQLLRKNGLIITTKAAKATLANQVWWLFPGLGAVLFLVTILFGGSLADAIWPPKQGFVPANITGDGTDEPNDTATSTDIETDFLQDALKASDQQHMMAEEEADELEGFFDPPASIEDIRDATSRALFDVAVGETQGVGVLLSTSGHVLVTAELVKDAFERRMTTVLSEGTLIEDYKTVYPKAGPVGNELVLVDMVEESDALDIALLKANPSPTFDVAVDFDRQPKVGDDVWLGLYQGRQAEPRKTSVVDQMTDARGVNYLILASSMAHLFEGSPVFSASGALIGILLQHDGRDLLLANRQIREKAPFMYKAIRGR